MEAVARFLKEHGITEVESTMPDMTGNARGKFYPTNKFLAEKVAGFPNSFWYRQLTANGRKTTTTLSTRPIKIWCWSLTRTPASRPLGRRTHCSGN
ncbi:hypothetical protein [Aliamphritea spongicola]|nr:hypothetical protein [Aliamphritea spongicola]